jgi:hypothetical protein
MASNDDDAPQGTAEVEEGPINTLSLQDPIDFDEQMVFENTEKPILEKRSQTFEHEGEPNQKIQKTVSLK